MMMHWHPLGRTHEKFDVVVVVVKSSSCQVVKFFISRRHCFYRVTHCKIVSISHVFVRQAISQIPWTSAGQLHFCRLLQLLRPVVTGHRSS